MICDFAFQDGRIDYSEFVAMMQDTGLDKKGFQNLKSLGLKNVKVGDS